IDRLAAKGVLFTRWYGAAPACNLSRAALMTGVRPFTSGVYHNPHPWRKAMPDTLTLPQHFMKHGYEAVGSGKIYHGAFPDPASWNDYLEKGGDPKPTAEVLNDPHSRAGGIVWGKLDVPVQQMNDYKMGNYAIEYLKKQHDKPFFLACGIFRPHMPWQVPQKYYDMYPLDKIQLPKTLDNDLEDIPEAGRKVAKPQGDHATILKTDNWKHAVQAYLASITFADEMVGRVVKALEESPHADNTIIVLWGDHGWHLGEKHHWRKFALWEEATRAPLIMVAPGVTKPNSICERTVDFMNIYPTLSELCGLPRPDHLEGVSLVSLLKQPDSAWDRPAITTHGRNNHAIRSERFRYIRYEDGSEELYDHETDPMEWKNLAKDPEFAKAKTELAKWLPKKNVPSITPVGQNRKKGNAKKKANQKQKKN
ncbi:MAG: sulfatase, partial [Planctomycetaceae bacterium]|nr:sulfatase [Planctomycetaceae bacterium]